MCTYFVGGIRSIRRTSTENPQKEVRDKFLHLTLLAIFHSEHGLTDEQQEETFSRPRLSCHFFTDSRSPRTWTCWQTCVHQDNHFFKLSLINIKRV